MKTTFIRFLSFVLLTFMLAGLAGFRVHAAVITAVVETGGDNEATDTVPAKWTGVTYVGGIANEPVPGLAAGASYIVPAFGSSPTPAFVDRNHRWTNAAPAAWPPYLLGQDYIMIGNDNRDNNNGTNGGTVALYRLDITVATAVNAYLLIDNRMGDNNNANAPTFGPTNMAWVVEDGWTPVLTGLNRFSNPALPDEVGIDENADGSINQYGAIYKKSFPAGTFSVKQPDNPARNMYGVVVQSVAPPATPAGLAATSGDTKVILSWSVSPGAIAYIVKRSLMSGGPYDNIATNASPGYVDTTVANDVTYYYVITAANIAGESADSNEVIGQPKAAPANVTAQGGTNQVTVQWDAFPAATGYTLKRSTVSGGPYSTAATGITGTSHTDTGLADGRFYYYVVIAQTGGGDSGQSSEAAGLTAPATPVAVDAVLFAASAIAVRWTASDPVIAQFNLEQSTNNVDFSVVVSPAGSQRGHTNSGLAFSNTWFYRVQAQNATGPSGYSAVSATPPRPPAGTSTSPTPPPPRRPAISRTRAITTGCGRTASPTAGPTRPARTSPSTPAGARAPPRPICATTPSTISRNPPAARSGNLTCPTAITPSAPSPATSPPSTVCSSLKSRMSSRRPSSRPRAATSSSSRTTSSSMTDASPSAARCRCRATTRSTSWTSCPPRPRR